jgi:hypothetical protein
MREPNLWVVIVLAFFATKKGHPVTQTRVLGVRTSLLRWKNNIQEPTLIASTGTWYFRCKERTPGNLHLVLAVFAIVVVVFARVVDVVVSATGWVIEHTCAYVAIAFVAADIWPRGCECGQTFWSQRRGTPYLAHQTSPWQTTGRQIIISQPLAVSIHGISYSLYII